MRDYLDLLKTADKDAIRARRTETATRLAQPKKGFLRFREPYEALHHLQARFTDFSKDAVTIGRAEELGETDLCLVREAMRSFMPWRKGPF